MRFLVILCVFGFIVGCSKEQEKPVFLGDRLLATAEVGADGKYYVPRLEGVQAQLKECQFKEFTDNYYQSECSFENAAPGRQRKPEILRIYLTSPRVGVSAIDIEQTQMDFEDGLSIFAKLKGVQIEQLSCPDIEIDNSASFNTMFYRIKRDGKAIGVYREVYNSGSGGADRTTTLYLGMSDAPCQWAEKNDKYLRKAISNGVVSYAEPMNSKAADLGPADSCADSENIKKCLENNRDRVNRYEKLVQIELNDEDTPYLDRYLAVGDDCDNLIKLKQQLSSGILFVWHNYRNDGVDVVSSSGTHKCGNGSDTEGGRLPKSMCPPLTSMRNPSVIKYPGSNIYFTNETLNSGLTYFKLNPTCGTYSKITRVKEIHYKSQSISSEGCSNKMNLAEMAASRAGPSVPPRNLLICTIK